MYKNIFFTLSLTVFLTACGGGNKAADEVCGCIDKGITNSDMGAVLKTLDGCTAGWMKTTENMSDEEKSEFIRQVNECIKNNVKVEGMKYTIGI